ncbi:MAG: hypothetical protein HY220_02370 [Candidatus Sungbacteria bacterium]|uniref:Transcriptional regulator n=1 Tax=Candidatus Sungiibacteriota bacterium TaxID=2750080 RepID=A0A9D6LN65_9BACT|nr:hypothetical protein [Candidatus Sungbacteria bacterium]
MELVLEKLFESKAKVRILRLFLRNPASHFSLDQVSRLVGLKEEETAKEISKFLQLGILKWRTTQVVVSELSGKGKMKKLRMRQKTVRVFIADENFYFFKELQALILRQVPESRHRLVSKIKKLGRVKLAIATGAFVNNDSARVDLLIVGDSINRRRLENMLHTWEANAGKELTYALMTTEEFKYRVDMFDRFTRDILETSHDKLINALNVS